MQSAWDKTRFGRLITEIVERTGLSQAAIARLAGVDPTRITRWKNGENRPDYDSIVRLVAGVSRSNPDIAVLAPDLFAAGGYVPDLPADDRPAIVRANWENEDVRKLWSLGVPEGQRVAMIQMILPPSAGGARSERHA
jgi:transcriptional regulator with XRE-family HTH domain